MYFNAWLGLCKKTIWEISRKISTICMFHSSISLVRMSYLKLSKICHQNKDNSYPCSWTNSWYLKTISCLAWGHIFCCMKKTRKWYNHMRCLTNNMGNTHLKRNWDFFPLFFLIVYTQHIMYAVCFNNGNLNKKKSWRSPLWILGCCQSHKRKYRMHPNKKKRKRKGVCFNIYCLKHTDF